MFLSSISSEAEEPSQLGRFSWLIRLTAEREREVRELVQLAAAAAVEAAVAAAAAATCSSVRLSVRTPRSDGTNEITAVS